MYATIDSQIEDDLTRKDDRVNVYMLLRTIAGPVTSSRGVRRPFDRLHGRLHACLSSAQVARDNVSANHCFLCNKT